MVRIARLTYDAALYVCLNLRPEDRREIYALRNDDNPVLLAHHVTRAAVLSDLAWVATWQGRPAAVLGAYELWPGVFEAFAFGTDDWPHVALALTRHGLRTLGPALRERGAHRFQAHSHADHHEAHRWLQSLGARFEAALPCFGRDGSTYHLYAWTDADNVFREDPQPAQAAAAAV